MKENKSKPIFGNLFNRSEDFTTSSTGSDPDSELMLCLYNLSTIGVGIDRKVDHEIVQFKKMIKIGSPVTELKDQVSVITHTLAIASVLPEFKKHLEIFRQLPAEILLDEFLKQPLSEQVQNQLKNYRDSLIKGTLATAVIEDLIGLLEANPEIPDTEPTEAESTDKAQICNIINPIFRMCSQLELTEEHSADLQNLINRSSTASTIDEIGLVLDSISNLILSSISNSTSQFESFLVQLKQRLDTVNTWILNSGETNKAISDCSNSFSEQISTQVSNIHTSFNKKENLVDLEDNVTANLDVILNGVSNFNLERQKLELQAAKTISELEKELEQTKKETEHLKNNLQQQKLRELTDPLTKLPNREAYNERLYQEFKRFERYNSSLSLIIGDIDYFKKINDTHGHIAGDTALKETAHIMQSSSRATDFIARFGGEEFVIIMPETNISDATKATNKIRLAIQQNLIEENNISFKLTMSFGVASFSENDTTKSVLDRADKALYRAKEKGRNLVCAQRI